MPTEHCTGARFALYEVRLDQLSYHLLFQASPILRPVFFHIFVFAIKRRFFSDCHEPHTLFHVYTCAFARVHTLVNGMSAYPSVICYYWSRAGGWCLAPPLAFVNTCTRSHRFTHLCTLTLTRSLTGSPAGTHMRTPQLRGEHHISTQLIRAHGRAE